MCDTKACGLDQPQNPNEERKKNQIFWFIVKFKCPIFHLSTDKHFGIFFFSRSGVTKWSFIDFFGSPEKKTPFPFAVFYCETFSARSVKWCVRYTNKSWGVFIGKKLNGSLVNRKISLVEQHLKREYRSISHTRHLSLNGGNFNLNRTMEVVRRNF